MCTYKPHELRKEARKRTTEALAEVELQFMIENKLIQRFQELCRGRHSFGNNALVPESCSCGGVRDGDVLGARKR